MRNTVVYPIPFDAWSLFESAVYNFTYTFRTFPPGDDYRLIAVCNWGKPSDRVRELFYGIKTIFVPYEDNGCDLGSHQFISKWLTRFEKDTNDYLICLSTRCFFHRAGWLARYRAARDKHGPGLYGVGTFEGRPHLRTYAYGIDSSWLARFPHTIDSRDKTFQVESGDLCLTDWVKEQGGATMQVTWDAEQEQDHWRDPKEEAIFRRNHQAACLVFDKHTEIFANATTEERTRLSAIADPH